MTDTKTSAQTLRDAAALMRERAQAATPGPWTVRREIDGMRAGQDTVVFAHQMRVVTVDQTRPHYSGLVAKANVAHIASMHPAVALATADWLEVTARDVGTSTLAYHAALAVARAYLGAS